MLHAMHNIERDGKYFDIWLFFLYRNYFIQIEVLYPNTDLLSRNPDIWIIVDNPKINVLRHGETV